MAVRNKDLVAATLRLAHTARIHRVLGSAAAGRGVVLMLHKIGSPRPGEVSSPGSRDLFVTPGFLAELIERIRDLDYDIVSMDEAVARLRGGSERRFAVLTFDDAYRDTLEVAYPVLQAAQAPFIVYVPTAWADGRGLIKWAVLEALAAAGPAIEPGREGLPARIPTATVQQRADAIAVLDRFLERLGPAEAEGALRDIADRHDIDPDGICRNQIMTWQEIGTLARDRLVTIGAHSVDHHKLSGLTRDELDRQFAVSKAQIESVLGLTCRHFAYPYGDTDAVGPREIAHAAAAGYETAVTTWRGVVQDHHQVRLTSLPRIAISGRMEDLRCVEMLISGVPDLVINRLTNRVA